MNIKQLIPFELKYQLLLYKAKYTHNSAFDGVILQDDKKKAFLFLAADYGNLGDVAITYAQTKFLESHGYQVIEIPISQTAQGIWWVNKHIQKQDIITLIGGGNMGDLYDQIEFLRQLVVKQFPNHKIISFPQTFDFSSTANGKRQLNTAKRVYNAHKNLTIVSREQTSYDLMRTNFPKCKVIITPDIVLSLDNVVKPVARQGVVICLRDDHEKSMDAAITEHTIDCLEHTFDQLIYRDTHIAENNLSIETRINALNDIWQTFSQAELVVTDRLHGMIFAYITRTPCIVFQNNNHKIRGTYDWIKLQGNIYLVENFAPETLKNMIQTLRVTGAPSVDLSDYYVSLVKEM